MSSICERHGEILKVALHALFHLLPFRVFKYSSMSRVWGLQMCRSNKFLLMPFSCFLACSCSAEVETMAGFVETLVGLALVVFAVAAVIGFIFLCEPSF